MASKKPYKWVEQVVVISAMRRAFRRYPAYKQCLDNAKTEYFIPSKHGKQLRRVSFTCSKCQIKNSRKLVDVDHTDPVVDPLVGFVDYNTYAKRLFCELDNLAILCKTCHKAKSKQEASLRAKTRKESHK